MLWLFCWWLVDIFSGIYHYATDNGYNFSSQVVIFQEHHDKPDEIVFDYYPILGSIPFFFLSIWWHNLAILATCIMFVQVPHYLVHKKITNSAIEFLQWTGFFIRPGSHALHHSDKFDKNYCVLTSWNNWWFNWLIWRHHGHM